MTSNTRDLIGVSRIDLVQHDIDNRVACIEVAAEMLCQPDLSPEDRRSLEKLRDQALSELRVLGTVPSSIIGRLH
jgi:hypothetical protein